MILHDLRKKPEDYKGKVIFDHDTLEAKQFAKIIAHGITYLEPVSQETLEIIKINRA